MIWNTLPDSWLSKSPPPKKKQICKTYLLWVSYKEVRHSIHVINHVKLLPQNLSEINWLWVMRPANHSGIRKIIRFRALGQSTEKISKSHIGEKHQNNGRYKVNYKHACANSNLVLIYRTTVQRVYQNKTNRFTAKNFVTTRLQHVWKHIYVYIYNNCHYWREPYYSKKLKAFYY